MQVLNCSSAENDKFQVELEEEMLVQEIVGDPSLSRSS